MVGMYSSPVTHTPCTCRQQQMVASTATLVNSGDTPQQGGYSFPKYQGVDVAVVPTQNKCTSTSDNNKIA